MASYTTNLNLKKPAGSENVAIGDINNNMDTIDTAYGTLNSNLNSYTKDYGAIGGFTAGPKFTIDSSRVQIFGAQAYMTVIATANQAYGNQDIIATIPENYRPIRNTTSMVSLLIRGTSFSAFTGMDTIGTDGTIKEGFTGSNGQVGDKYIVTAIYQVKS